MSFWSCVVALLLTCLKQSYSQTVPCSTQFDCSDFTLENSVKECCILPDTLSYKPSIGAEICRSCFVYGWVQNISEDLTSADPQEDIHAIPEGEEITLNVYFTKNGPASSSGLLFTIQTGGTATEDIDYTLSISNMALLDQPVPVTVTLLSDGVTGEAPETIILTLVQDTVTTPSDLNQIFVYDIVHITIQDNDFETGFRVSELTISENSNVQEACLTTVGTPASDTIITVRLIPGSIREGDFSLITEQVVITPTSPEPCVQFIAVADSLGLEGEEMLSLSLSGPGNALFGISTINITITDADGREEEEDSSSIIIAITVVAILIVLVSISAAVVGVLLYMRKRREKELLSENAGPIYDTPEFVKQQDSISPTENIAYGSLASQRPMKHHESGSPTELQDNIAYDSLPSQRRMKQHVQESTAPTEIERNIAYGSSSSWRQMKQQESIISQTEMKGNVAYGLLTS